MHIGPYQLDTPVIAAPMAGVSDKPYRQICRRHGAGLVVSEMVTSKAELRHSRKTQLRSDFDGEPDPVMVQIVGTEPRQMAEAARYNVANGAQIIDINMGCPAKKVCSKKAGSALLADPDLVTDILDAVVNAVTVPVTLKIRTGIDLEHRNATHIAHIAEQAGIQMLTIHGRTRACKFTGHAEYDTIAQVKQQVSIPIVANGDICTPEQAQTVLDHTKADAVMIGRAAYGQPWLFKQVADYLVNGQVTEIENTLKVDTILSHLKHIHEFYGDFMGVRIARKHLKRYFEHWHTALPESLKHLINASEDPLQQTQHVESFLTQSTATQSTDKKTTTQSTMNSTMNLAA